MFISELTLVFSCLFLNQCNLNTKPDIKSINTEKNIKSQKNHPFYKPQYPKTKSPQQSKLLHRPLQKYISNSFQRKKAKQLNRKQNKSIKVNSLRDLIDIKRNVAFYPSQQISSYANRFENNVNQDVYSQPVQVDVYFESLCPDSQEFIAKQLWPTFQELYDSKIFKLSLYPYGNAQSIRIDDHWRFTCQHGELECVLNLIETCVIYTYPDPILYLPYIKCVEENPTEVQANKCAVQTMLDINLINQCVTSKQGNQYQYIVGRKTPAHSFIPWIQINGEGKNLINEQAIDDLKGLICRTYQGVKPEKCAPLPLPFF